ncbi:hypothetical protein NM688_g7206 [Phlebia brevispora]|uniref:Uncharacterized protein n=1 Tax=Phlebia brevispora TaxID=194682 RepID=A0ACC1S858_9APHY|nr:hypothetical protein NM688_g7206 [Phlebia brevispora]
MAPEVLQGTTKPNEASDVYSLGLTIWQMFSDGRVPYANFYDSNRLIERVVDEGYRESRPARLTEDYVWDLLQKCWAAKAEDRPTAQDVLRVLARSRVRMTRTVRTNLFTNAMFEGKGGSPDSSNRAVVARAPPNPIQKTVTPGDLMQSDVQDTQDSMMTLRSELSLVSDVYKGSDQTYIGSDTTYKGSDAMSEAPSDSGTGAVDDDPSRSDVPPKPWRTPAQHLILTAEAQPWNYPGLRPPAQPSRNENEETYKGSSVSGTGGIGDNVNLSDDDITPGEDTPKQDPAPASTARPFWPYSKDYVPRPPVQPAFRF